MEKPGKRAREIELKLELDGDGAAALARHPLLRKADANVARQISTYFDTPAGDLRKAGFTLRVRQSNGRFVQTVKRDADGGAGLFDRPEWEQEVEGPDPDREALKRGPLGDALPKKVRNGLAPVTACEVKRTTWQLDRGDEQVELTFDEGWISGGSARAPIHELEIERREGGTAFLFDVARELARAVPARIGVRSKAERGFALAEGQAARITKAEPVSLEKDSTVAEGFAAIGRACLRHYRLNEPLVIDSRQADALHQTRVAMRRLRSAFSLFGRVIRDEPFERLREETRWFTNQLGDARDLDVLLKRLPGSADATALRSMLEAAREQTYGRVVAAMCSERVRMLVLELVVWMETGPWQDRKRARKPLAGYAAKQLDKRWRRVRKRGSKIGDLGAEARHRLRIDVKKLRYAAEFLASLHPGDRHKAFVGSLQEMQERLGELNDAETARGLIGDLVRDKANHAELERAAARALPDPKSGAGQLRAAKAAYARLVEAGAFWER